MNKHIMKMKEAHEIIAEFSFEVVELEKGYTNRYLVIDLDTNEIKIHPVTDDMKKNWVGGKGFDLWLTFKHINKNTKWDSPENPIVFSPGPLAGTTSFPGSGKTIVTAISPATNIMVDSNVGGYFGPFLKFAGFDALMVTGKAKDETLILIDPVNNKITLESAPLESIDSHVLSEELTEMYADNVLDMRNIAVVSSGRAAKHTRMGLLNFSFYDWRRKLPRLKQAGRGGIGTVFRNKNLKAIVIKNINIIPDWSVQENKVQKLVVPKSFEKVESEKSIQEINEIIVKWKSDPEYVIEMMQDIQEEFRFIPKVAIEEINRMTGTPKAYLYHISTFYKTFSLEKKGKTTIQVCMGTACHVKGSAKLLDAFERILNIKKGGTTQNKKYSLEAVACLGACSIAPVIKIGDEVYGNVKITKLEKMIAEYEKKMGGENE